VKPLEIERKYLVQDLPVEDDMPGTSMTQGYLPSREGLSARVRLTPDGCYLTVKGARAGAVRVEHECEIPEEIAELLLVFCDDRIVSKMRYPMLANGRLWVIDVFQDRNDGLILAELELSSPDEPFTLPGWCGAEVTEDERYYNEFLASNPYSEWEK
jgi:adenylate cyclase